MGSVTEIVERFKVRSVTEIVGRFIRKPPSNISNKPLASDRVLFYVYYHTAQQVYQVYLPFESLMEHMDETC